MKTKKCEHIEILKELENVKEMKTTELEWYYNKI